MTTKEKLPHLPRINEQIRSRLKPPYDLIAEWLQYTAFGEAVRRRVPAFVMRDARRPTRNSTFGKRGRATALTRLHSAGLFSGMYTQAKTQNDRRYLKRRITLVSKVQAISGSRLAAVRTFGPTSLGSE